jgi:hypothetical protein
MLLAGSSFVIAPTIASARASSGTGASVCVPTVEPVPITPSSPGFKAVFQPDLPTGWIDEEFFVSCSSPGLAYKTAVFVRRPADPRRASGIVAVDPLHSVGLWGMQALIGSYFFAHDVVQVGVAASNDAEHVLKGANPTRYASLDVPSTPDAPNEILAGVGVLLHQKPRSLVSGARVHSVILGGWSQTSVMTRTFISSPQAKATVGGHRPFDGYFPGQAAVGSSGKAPVGSLPDIGVPILDLEGERELLVTIAIYGKVGYRRPDSNTYRLYEVAGMSHVNHQPDSPVSGFAGGLTCDTPPGATPSAFRQTDIWGVTFDNLVRWVTTGRGPPHAPRIQLEPDGKTVKRDARGNVIGGVRSVFVDVPTAGITATSLAPGGVVRNPCAYVGYQLDLSPQQLRQLYGTHAGYVRQVTKDTAKLVRERFLLPGDARALVVAARESNVLR